MGIKGSASSEDITIPKGVVIAYPIVSNVVDLDGGIDLGYVQESSLTVSETTREVYSARDDSMAKAVSKVVQTDYSLPLEVMSVTPDNLALMFRGETGSEVQVVGYYDDAAALAITGPAALNRAQKLGKRWVSTQVLNFDGGTGAFAIGQTVTGGTSTETGKIVWKTGTTAAGTLVLVDVSGAFTDNEAITDAGTGAAVANGTNTVEDDIVLTDTGASTRYALDTDYGIDPKSGTVFYLDTGSITALEVLEGYFDYAAKTETVIQHGATGISNYQVEILAFSGSDQYRYESTFWNCSIALDADVKLITVSEEETIVNITMTPLTEGPGATADFPVYKIVSV